MSKVQNGSGTSDTCVWYYLIDLMNDDILGIERLSSKKEHKVKSGKLWLAGLDLEFKEENILKFE